MMIVGWDIMNAYEDVFFHTKVLSLKIKFWLICADRLFFLLDFQVLESINECNGDFSSVFYKYKCVSYGFMHSFFVNSKGHL